MERSNLIHDVSFYRETPTTYSYPKSEGKVFAGWYKDAKYTQPLGENVKTGLAYAKWVDQNVLSVKAQVDANLTGATEDRTTMRIVTTVDDLDYQNVSFHVETQNAKKDYEVTTVYKTIASRIQGQTFDNNPNIFSSESQYFATVVIENLKATSADLEKTFTIIPYWKTADGTKVAGSTRTLTLQEGINANNQVY